MNTFICRETVQSFHHILRRNHNPKRVKNYCSIVTTLQILFFFKLKKKIFFFFLAVLGPRCRAQAFSSCSERGLLFVVVRGLHCTGFSCCRARALGVGFSSCGSWALERRLSSCGARAQLLHGMWDLPGPGIEPVSPAFAGRFFFLFLLTYLFIYLFIYLFMAVSGLRFCARAFSSCGKWGPLFIAVRGPLTIAASLVAEHRLQMRKVSNCGSRAQLLCGMWDLPRPGLEPVSPALAGRFSTTASPGKPGRQIRNHCATREVPSNPLKSYDSFIVISIFPFPDDLGQNATGLELPQLGSTEVTKQLIVVKTSSFYFLRPSSCTLEQFNN